MNDSRICHPNNNNMKKILLFTIGIWFLSVGYSHAQENSPLHRFESYGKWGYVDDKGNRVISCKYDHAYPFYESDLALVGSDGQFGYINKEGQVKIPLQYKKAYPFSDGVAAVKKAGINKYGFINSKGEEIVKFGYSDVKWGFVEGYAWVKEGKNWGMINKKGDKASGFNYVRLSYFDPNTGVTDAVTKDGATHYYYKGKKYFSKRERDEAMNPRPEIIWPVIPAETKQPQFVLKAEVVSESEIEYCKVYLNGVEVLENDMPGGSFIAKDPEYYKVTINRTLALKEGTNSITIKAKNQGGETEEEKTIEFKKSIPVKALIVWNDIPATTIESRLELDATVKSTVREVYYRVLLNGVEVSKTKGSSIVEDSKEIEYKYKLSVTRTIVLQEVNNGDNIITIEVRNAKGGLVATDKKHVTYTKPALATIEWGDVPSYTEEKLLTLRAQIVSESPIEYYKVMRNEKLVRSFIVNPVVAPGGSSIMQDPNEEEYSNSVAIEEIVELSEGDNSFVIEVKNDGGIIQSQPKKVSYKQKEKRIALVIGNADYQNIHFPKLTKTKADAQAMYKLFESLGFDMMPMVLDADLKTMRAAINEFVDTVGKGDYDVALLYYSGHGLSPDGGANYFIPIDAKINYLDEVKDNALNSQIDLIAKLKDKDKCRVKIALLDCCNSCAVPSKGAKSGAYSGRITDLLKEPTVGISVIHAALPSQDAIEGKEEVEVSPFVEAFLECVKKYPNDAWPLFIDNFKNLVHILTDGRQTPYPEGGFIGKPFYLVPRHQ